MKKLLLIAGLIVAVAGLMIVIPSSAPAFYGYGMVATYGGYWGGYCGGYGYPVYGAAYGGRRGFGRARGVSYGVGYYPWWGGYYYCR